MVGSTDRLHGLSAHKAAARVAAQRWDPDVFAAYVEAQQRLADLFCRPATWVRERTRLAGAMMTELHAILDGTPPMTPADPEPDDLRR